MAILKSGKNKKVTMDSLYGDGSDHEACPACGFCKTCGDCRQSGCGEKKDSKNTAKKALTKKEKLMIEGYKKTAKQNLEIESEWKYASVEADKLLDDY